MNITSDVMNRQTNLLTYGLVKWLTFLMIFPMINQIEQIILCTSYLHIFSEGDTNSNTDKPVALISGSNWNLKCWFLWKEENQRTRRKTLGAGTRTNNKLNLHVQKSDEVSCMTQQCQKWFGGWGNSGNWPVGIPYCHCDTASTYFIDLLNNSLIE